MPGSYHIYKILQREFLFNSLFQVAQKEIISSEKYIKFCLNIMKVLRDVQVQNKIFI